MYKNACVHQSAVVSLIICVPCQLNLSDTCRCSLSINVFLPMQPLSPCPPASSAGRATSWTAWTSPRSSGRTTAARTRSHATQWPIRSQTCGVRDSYIVTDKGLHLCSPYPHESYSFECTTECQPRWLCFPDIKLDGCQTEDKDECTTEMKGPNDAFTCYCKTDFCNGANTVVSHGIVAAIATLTVAMF